MELGAICLHGYSLFLSDRSQQVVVDVCFLSRCKVYSGVELVFLEIPIVTTWTVFQNQVTYAFFPTWLE